MPIAKLLRPVLYYSRHILVTTWCRAVSYQCLIQSSWDRCSWGVQLPVYTNHVCTHLSRGKKRGVIVSDRRINSLTLLLHGLACHFHFQWDITPFLTHNWLICISTKKSVYSCDYLPAVGLVHSLRCDISFPCTVYHVFCNASRNRQWR